jgi:hypothetical protein
MLPWWQAHNIKIFQLEAPTLRSAAALSLTSEVRFCVALLCCAFEGKIKAVYR